MTDGSLMKVETIAECSPWSIMQYFWPALSYNWSWNQFSVFYLSGHLRQVLLCLFKEGADTDSMIKRDNGFVSTAFKYRYIP